MSFIKQAVSCVLLIPVMLLSVVYITLFIASSLTGVLSRKLGDILDVIHIWNDTVLLREENGGDA